MKLQKTILIFSSTLILSMLACNLGVQAPSSTSPSPRDAAATIVAQTLQAQGLPTSAGQVLNSPAPAATATQETSATATLSTPILTINQATNCRSGPSTNYDIITSAPAGTKAEIVGKDTADNYWLIKTPNGTGTCWMSGEYATPGGDYASLPETTPEAPTPGVPARPGSLYFKYSCTNNATTVTTTLTWSDNANNETGYHVYRSDTMIADLPANSTSYVDTTNITYGSTLTYYVEAYNAAGASDRRSATFSCQ
jgi:hypothetical protein